ncbi:transcriptional regulator [Candidatus Epulonipiscium fishelsonii]|uniref:Transcriptional regulator n=1 Tax=Candidatus Epulonipiscium fishelsonii TaxID=77094 RepID=A0ACC8XCK9_9FIRM|nr:transcriptional regulator [Epulopiscium sp. SCG-B11WGA-EpuloA1]ONI43204.1 transcriptional regulator [Epulopiscium sp. SCG-B05WGA-EpuloA1]
MSQKKNITMRDLAKELNISTVTVSKALGDKEGVGDELKNKIKLLAKERGYKHNSIAKSMKEGCTYNIGVIACDQFISDNDNCFYWKIYQKLTHYLAKQNYTGILEIIYLEQESNKEMPNMIMNNKVDGIIILGQINEEYISAIIREEIPILFLDFYNNNFEMDSIISDNFYGGYIATNYLISRGCKTIGFVGNIYSTSSILDRYLGCQKSLIENQMELNLNWIISDRTNIREEYCKFTLPDVLPEAFVCNCDEVAFYFIQELNKIGLSVPEDISIVSFDNFIYSTLSKPKITTIEVNIDFMCEFAVNNIIKKIKGKDYSKGRNIVNSNLIIRDSVK